MTKKKNSLLRSISWALRFNSKYSINWVVRRFSFSINWFEVFLTNIVEINDYSISILQMQLKSNNRELNLVEKKIEYSSSDFAEFYSTRVMKNLDFVNEFIVVLSIRTRFIDSTNSSKIEKYIDVIAFLENIFVQIFHEFRIDANLNVDMSFIFLQKSKIVKNHSLVVWIFSLDELARKTTILRYVWMMTHIRHHWFLLRKSLDASIFEVMTKSFFDSLAILVNHLFNNQLVESLAYRVELKYFLEKYDCMNDVVNVVLIEFISKIRNEKNMSMR